MIGYLTTYLTLEYTNFDVFKRNSIGALLLSNTIYVLIYVFLFRRKDTTKFDKFKKYFFLLWLFDIICAINHIRNMYIKIEKKHDENNNTKQIENMIETTNKNDNILTNVTDKTNNDTEYKICLSDKNDIINDNNVSNHHNQINIPTIEPNTNIINPDETKHSEKDELLCTSIDSYKSDNDNDIDNEDDKNHENVINTNTTN